MPLLFSTNSNPKLANFLTKEGLFNKGKAKVSKFADQEISILLETDVENKDVYVLGSSFPPGDNLLELTILIHTLKENGAKSVKALVPYWGYAKADRIKPKGATLSAKLMADFIKIAGADEISVANIHSQFAADFFDIPVKHIDLIPLLANYFKKNTVKDVVIISPDKGGVARAEEFAEMIGTKEIAYISKTRPEFDEAEIKHINGNVEGKNCIIVDDMIQSGGTIVENAKTLKEHGAKNVYVAVIHILHLAGCIERLNADKNVDQVIFTNTVPPKENIPGKFKLLDISEYIKDFISQKIL